ncbi:MAG: 1,2-phenylacetyl-CoA epoxidase subunit PaaD [Ilumatobacteraceae bacterium]|nr:1,2-phenylacetyl-CoA epoxidase subunit PaaD [Ilumatobacteraceae bacterium]
MVTTIGALDELVRDIDDPELPHVTIGDLGIVRSVEIDRERGTATVVLTPTYTGCPATDQIRDDVTAAVVAAGFEPDVQFAISPAWTTDWITERGRERLRAAGITPPPPVGEPGVTFVDPPVACPRCGSRRTRLISQFGATACKASYVCSSCSEPFELFKAL